MSQALNKLGFAQMARQIRAGGATAEAVMQACIERIRQREPEVGVRVVEIRSVATADSKGSKRQANPLDNLSVARVVETPEFEVGVCQPELARYTTALFR